MSTTEERLYWAAVKALPTISPVWEEYRVLKAAIEDYGEYFTCDHKNAKRDTRGDVWCPDCHKDLPG